MLSLRADWVGVVETLYEETAATAWATSAWGSHVRLAVSTGSINIGDRIGGGGTEVLYWPANTLQVKNGIDSNGSATAFPWSNLADWCKQRPVGYYWHDLTSAAAK
jgi:hypothetical protein